MKQINYCIGLPRSGSTLLMNILQQNPKIFTSATCPTPYLIQSSKDMANSVSEFIAMDQDQLNRCWKFFIKNGINGWYEGLTEKPIVFSKSRVWDNYLDIIFGIYESPKIIVNLRDLRDIVYSFEKLLFKYPIWNSCYEDKPLVKIPLEQRVKIYCTDQTANLGRPLSNLPLVVEWAKKRPECFYFLRIEDFNKDPLHTIKEIYKWLDLDDYKHDLDNIKNSDQYEHDTVYRALVTHKIEPKWRPLTSTYDTYLSEYLCNTIIGNNSWYYYTFYPEVYDEFKRSYQSSSSQ